MKVGELMRRSWQYVYLAITTTLSLTTNALNFSSLSGLDVCNRRPSLFYEMNNDGPWDNIKTRWQESQRHKTICDNGRVYERSYERARPGNSIPRYNNRITRSGSQSQEEISYNGRIYKRSWRLEDDLRRYRSDMEM